MFPCHAKSDELTYNQKPSFKDMEELILKEEEFKDKSYEYSIKKESPYFLKDKSRKFRLVEQSWRKGKKIGERDRWRVMVYKFDNNVDAEEYLENIKFSLSILLIEKEVDELDNIKIDKYYLAEYKDGTTIIILKNNILIRLLQFSDQGAKMETLHNKALRLLKIIEKAEENENKDKNEKNGSIK